MNTETMAYNPEYKLTRKNKDGKPCIILTIKNARGAYSVDLAGICDSLNIICAPGITNLRSKEYTTPETLNADRAIIDPFFDKMGQWIGDNK